MKKRLVIIFILFTSFSTTAQVALGYFPWGYSQVQLSSSPSKLAFADLRVETNTFFANLNIELGLFVNLSRKEVYNLYLGPGVASYPFYNEDRKWISGYFMTAGVRWMPLKNLRNLAVIFEISPYLNNNLEGGRLRSNLGLSYAFGR